MGGGRSRLPPSPGPNWSWGKPAKGRAANSFLFRKLSEKASDPPGPPQKIARLTWDSLDGQLVGLDLELVSGLISSGLGWSILMATSSPGGSLIHA